MHKIFRVVIVALVVCATLGVARAAQTGKTPAAKVPPVVTQYLAAIKRADYSAAFALLTASEQKYFRSSANFASRFTADQFKIGEFRVDRVESSKAGQVAFVREAVTYLDLRNDKQAVAQLVTPLGIVSEKGSARIKDPGHPWKARGLKVSGEKDQLRVTIKKVEFFAHRVRLALTFANLGDTAITLLPYGRTVMRDDQGNVYRIIQVKDWRLTDRELFLGLRLAPNAQYTGALNFELNDGAADPKSFDLTVAPALRDGAEGPFTVDVGPIALS